MKQRKEKIRRNEKMGNSFESLVELTKKDLSDIFGGSSSAEWKVIDGQLVIVYK